MAAFDYIALDTNGRRHKGVFEADSERQMRQLLRERGLTPFSVQEAARARDQKTLREAPERKIKGIGLRETSVVTRQLATLIQAGLPIEQALQALSRQSENPAMKSMLASLRGQVLEGNSLAASLAAFPRVFSELFRTSVYAGEHTGHLGMVLEYLADFSESSYQSRQRILLALLYPAILSGVSLLIIVFLLAYIVPDMVRVFTGAGHALPLLTRGLIVISDGIQHYGLIIVLVLAGGFFAGYKWVQRPAVRMAWDRHILRWPLIGKLSLNYAAARFSATLGMLHESGVPLVQALDIAIATLSNRYLRSSMRQVAVHVSEGVSLSRSMEKSGMLPPVLVTMAASGEASGQLGDMLKRASQIQQRDLDNRIALLLGLFEPMILLVMGALVLLLVLAIIMPILNLNQLVK